MLQYFNLQTEERIQQMDVKSLVNYQSNKKYIYIYIYVCVCVCVCLCVSVCVKNSFLLVQREQKVNISK